MVELRRDGDLRVFRLDAGEFFPAALLALLTPAEVPGGCLSGIGAFERATVAYFDTVEGRYLDLSVPEPTEVVALSGNLAWLDDGRPFAHVHVALSRRDGGVIAGHLREGVVNPTLEVFLLPTTRALRRVIDPVTGLGRLDLSR